jgi:predicted esterase
MSWVRLAHGFRLDPIAKGPPEALVALLHDVGAGAATLTPVAARWATSVPTTAFIALDLIDQRDQASGGLRAEPTLHRDAGAIVLDRASRQLAPLLEHQLRAGGLDASRLVLVGFGHGGTLALHMALHHGRSCGALAFAAKLLRPLPRILRVDHKVRLIECMGDGDGGHGGLRDVVATLTARGIDVRGVVLAGPVLSDAAIRHGEAYLVELVATAQRHRVRKTSRHAETLLTVPE